MKTLIITILLIITTVTCFSQTQHKKTKHGSVSGILGRNMRAKIDSLKSKGWIIDQVYPMAEGCTTLYKVTFIKF